MAEYLNLAFASQDIDFILSAIGDVAKAINLEKLSAKTGIEIKSLEKVIREGGRPQFEAVLKVLQAIGIQLKVHTNI
jgi:probable addiction module antidote protein